MNSTSYGQLVVVGWLVVMVYCTFGNNSPCFVSKSSKYFYRYARKFLKILIFQIIMSLIYHLKKFLRFFRFQRISFSNQFHALNEKIFLKWIVRLISKCYLNKNNKNKLYLQKCIIILAREHWSGIPRPRIIKNKLYMQKCITIFTPEHRSGIPRLFICLETGMNVFKFPEKPKLFQNFFCVLTSIEMKICFPKKHHKRKMLTYKYTYRLVFGHYNLSVRITA